MSTVDLKTPILNKPKTTLLSRRDKFYFRYRMMQDDYLDQVTKRLNEIYTKSHEIKLDKQTDMTNNIFKTVVEEISRVYSFGVSRETDNETMKNIIDSGLVDKVMKQANKYVNAFNDVLLQVSWNEKTMQPKFIFRLPHKTEVVIDDYDNIIEVEYLVEIQDDGKEKWAYWSEKEHYYKIKNIATGTFEKSFINGNDNGVNPYGVLPFVSMKNGFRDGTFWDTFKGDDLVAITLDNAVYSTFRNYMIKWQSFKQLVITGTNVGAVSGQVLDPSSALTITGQDVNFSILDLQANIKELGETIDTNATKVAINYKISPNQFRLTSQVSSGFALKMENQKLDEFTKQQQNDFVSYEKQLFDLIALMYTKNNIKCINDVAININKPVYSESRTDTLNNYEKSISLGIRSPIEIIMEEQDVTEEEAIGIYEDNIKYRNNANNRLNETALNIDTTQNALDQANQ